MDLWRPRLRTAIGVSPAGLSTDHPLPAVLLAAIGGCVLGVCTVVSPQLGCAVALVGTVALLYATSPTVGLLVLWAVWLLTPGLRRLFGLLGPYQQNDPLSLAPFVATAAVACVHVTRTRLDPHTRRVLALGALGLMVGIPAGASNPVAMTYNLIAYGGVLLAFELGRRERAPDLEALSLRRALVFGGPLLALYGLAQYFLAPTSWDRLWLSRAALGSVGAPEAGHVRIFSALNAPGTLAAVLALTLLFYLGALRPRPIVIAAAVLVLAALALTYVRTTWIAFALAAITLAALARTAMARLLVVTCAALVIGALAVGQATPTTAAFAQRLETFGALNSDTSANARQQSFFSRLPDAASRPLGHGLGSAGEATKLGADSDLRAPDNGYLSLLYQLGPVGFILFMAAVGVALTPLLKAVLLRGARDRESTLLLAIAVFLVVQLAGGDLFYGVTGAMVWYLLGRSVTVARRI